MIKRLLKIINSFKIISENYAYIVALILLMALIPMSGLITDLSDKRAIEKNIPSQWQNQALNFSKERYTHSKKNTIHTIEKVITSHDKKTHRPNFINRPDNSSAKEHNEAGAEVLVPGFTENPPSSLCLETGDLLSGLPVKKEKNEKEDVAKYLPLSVNSLKEEKELPRGISGEFKGFMDYRKITDKKSRQWKMQLSSKTDSDGFRRYKGLYMVALGSYYAPEVGMKFEIKLGSGKIIKCITGDVKNNLHTDPTNRFVEDSDSIIEFIVDTEKIDSMTRIMGDMSHSGMDGEVVEIIKIKN